MKISAARGLGSLSASFLHAGGFCGHSEFSRWDNFDGGFGRETEKQKETVPYSPWERDIGMVI